jgi:phage shock protein PspC (stress-responsive transcriptional regulator)
MAMTSQDTPRTNAPGRLLRRRTADRVIGGVAGGLGDYFNVDPLLFRIGFVGLIIFGGAGLVLYLIAWLLLPAEGHDASVVEAFFRRLGITPRGLAWTAIAILLLIVIQAVISPGGYLWIGDGPRLEGPAWIALAVVGVGIWLLRRRDAAAPQAVATAVVVPPRAPAVPRPRSPLGWYVLAATLIVVGLLALVSQAAGVEVTPGQFFGAGLTVIGIGLVVGAWWGRARILVLLALLLLPVAVPASFITAPLEGGIGDQRYTPANLAELRGDYRLLGGRLVLDLTGLSRRSDTIHVVASVALGELVVLLPENASVQLDARVGAGSTIVFDSRQVGTSLHDRYVRNQFSGATYVLDLEAGIGEVQVVMQPARSN